MVFNFLVATLKKKQVKLIFIRYFILFNIIISAYNKYKNTDDIVYILFMTLSLWILIYILH